MRSTGAAVGVGFEWLNPSRPPRELYRYATTNRICPMTVEDHNPYSPPIGDPPIVRHVVVPRGVTVTIASVYSIAVCFFDVRIGKASGEWWAANSGHLVLLSHFLLLLAPIAFLFQYFRFKWHATVRYFFVRTVISGIAMAGVFSWVLKSIVRPQLIAYVGAAPQVDRQSLLAKVVLFEIPIAMVLAVVTLLGIESLFKILIVRRSTHGASVAENKGVTENKGVRNRICLIAGNGS